MEENKTKAIVLKNAPFRDRQCILTLLSEDRGLIRMIVKGLSSKRTDLSASTTPLTEVEFTYSEGRSELLKCRSASIINAHLPLRNSYSILMAATRLAAAILLSQKPGKESEVPYILFSSFLKNLPRYPGFSDALTCSFLLKLLKHEGVFHLSTPCEACSLLEARAIYGAQAYCKAHAPSDATIFSDEEWTHIKTLTHASSFSALGQIEISQHFKKKIDVLFEMQLKR